MHPGSAATAVSPGGISRAVSANEMYDPATKNWEIRQTMPTAPNHAYGGVIDGKIYGIGGRLGAAGIGAASNSDLVEQYDPAIDSWAGAGARMPTPRSGGASVTYGGRIYVAGGEVNTPQLVGAFRAVEVYDPMAKRWSPFLSIPNPRHGVAGGVVGNKFHLVSGNITSGGGGDPKIYVHSSEHNVIELPDCRAVTATCL